MSRNHEAIRSELERLKTGGVIRPADVVEAAKDDASPLHGLFEWDDNEAAHQYRLLQARNILRVYVTVEESSATPLRAFVSLTTDRVKDGGGYRAMSDVMDDSAMREQLLKDAFVQFRNMRKRYQHLQQLARVWDAVEAAEAAQEHAEAA